ncbi:hypothetical protein AAG906_037135 [Vitis piasezkii]
MGSFRASCKVLFCFFFLVSSVYQFLPIGADGNQTAQLIVDTKGPGRKMPETLFGLFFEEINHAGAGGLWAELVSNRGFEAGGPITPSNIDPWAVIGNESYVVVATDRSSPFERNKVALRVEVLCGNDSNSTNICPAGGVGVYNPGYWGMNVEQNKWFTVVMHVRSEGAVNISVALTSSNGVDTLAATNFVANACTVGNWTKYTANLRATATNSNARLQLTTTKKGVIWFDQVSLMPVDTYRNHNFRKDLSQMIADLKPRFLRFPGGCFVEGDWLRNAFRWKQTIGPWEERPGHFGDVWKYWTDDGLGYFEFLQLAEDIGALPVWVFNNGISHNDEVDTTSIGPFVQEVLDSIEFARGASNSTWGSVRTAMGHEDPFNLKYIAVGNEDCWKKNYRVCIFEIHTLCLLIYLMEGIAYLVMEHREHMIFLHAKIVKFYDAIKRVYPDIKLITNCDASSRKLNHPADYYDFHIYTSAINLYSMAHQFDRTSRDAPKAFVSEYAVTGKDAGSGTLLAALAEAAFLIGVEKNSDVVEMASYAPLFVNSNDRTWSPDAIVFNSSFVYGTPSYWMQHFFSNSSGATLLNSTLTNNSSMSLKISVDGLQTNSLQLSGATKTVLTSSNVMDENSFKEPTKVAPFRFELKDVGKDLDAELPAYSFTAFDLLTDSSSLQTVETDAGYKSSI